MAAAARKSTVLGGERSGKPPRSGPWALLSELGVRMFFFVFQTARVVLFTALAFGLAAGGSYLLLRQHIQREEVVIPNVAGYPVDEALRILTRRDGRLSIRLEGQEYSDLAAPGEIVSQFPRAGNRAKPGSVVRVTISRGSTLVECPDVVGMNHLEAGIALRGADLAEGERGWIHSTSVEADRVIGQEPVAGSLLDRETPVNLLVSLGPPQPEILMPDLTDHTVQEAEEIVAPLGLRIVEVDHAPRAGMDNGLIFHQTPPYGSPVSTQDAIHVTVVNNLIAE